MGQKRLDYDVDPAVNTRARCRAVSPALIGSMSKAGRPSNGAGKRRLAESRRSRRSGVCQRWSVCG